MTQDPQRPPSPDDGGLPDYRPTPAEGPIPGTGNYTNPAPANTSAVVLTVVSGLLILSGVCCPVGAVPFIFGILGLTQNSSDPENAARMTRIGWIILVLLTVLLVLAIVGAVFFIATGSPSGGVYTSL